MITLEMTVSQAVEELERGLGLTPEELAGALDASTRTLARWRGQANYPQHDARQRLAALLELDQRLQDTFDSRQAIVDWMRGENRYLGGLRPVDAARVGRVDCIHASLDALDEGIFV